MKKSKRLISLFLALMMVISAIAMNTFNSFAADKTTITVENKEAKIGDTIDVNVTISNNTGILGAILSLKYDDALTLTDAKEGSAFNMLSMTKPGKYQSPCKFSWDGVELTQDDIKDGTILVLTFKVENNAIVGNTYNIEFSYNDGEIIDSNLNTVNVEINNATVKINENTPEHRHSYSSSVTNPTCTNQGYTTYTCVTCDDTYKADYKDPLGHNVIIDKAVNATCTTAGKTEGQICSVCKTIISGCEVIVATGHKTATTVTKATTSKNGSKVTTCTECGAQTEKSTIYYPKTITLSATKYTYDGKVKKPTVKVVDANGKTVAATNYTVTYASGRKIVGKYTVKITFKGNYSGTVSKTFTIVPKTTSISSLTAASKGFTVKWKKQATQTTGYQIQYSTSSKFTSPKTVTVTKNSTVSKKITKLTAKKKYYVRIRTYKTVSGTKYYSAWSGSKSVTTKK